MCQNSGSGCFFFFIGQQNYLTDIYACSFVWCFLFKCYIHLSKKHSSKNHTPLILIQSSVSLENLPQSMSFYQLRIFTHLFSYLKKKLFGKFLSQSIKDNLTLDFHHCLWLSGALAVGSCLITPPGAIPWVPEKQTQTWGFHDLISCLCFLIFRQFEYFISINNNNVKLQDSISLVVNSLTETQEIKSVQSR